MICFQNPSKSGAAAHGCCDSILSCNLKFEYTLQDSYFMIAKNKNAMVLRSGQTINDPSLYKWLQRLPSTFGKSGEAATHLLAKFTLTFHTTHRKLLSHCLYITCTADVWRDPIPAMAAAFRRGQMRERRCTVHLMHVKETRVVKIN